MARRVLSGVLIVLSGVFLILSLAGIPVVWMYNEPLTREVTGRLKEVDTQLAQAQATLVSSEKELQRALRIVDNAQTALEKLTQKTQSASSLFDNIRGTLDDQLIPDLKTTRDRIAAARTTLENLQSILANIRSIVPGIDLSVPDKNLKDLIASTQSLDKEISNVQDLAQQASTFVGDSSYLLGGDLTETRASLQSFLSSIQDYEKKLAGWREQDRILIAGTPRWIDEASIVLTIFLAWFALSQLGLFLHGANLRAGGDPFVVWRRRPREVSIAEEEEIALEGERINDEG